VFRVFYVYFCKNGSYFILLRGGVRVYNKISNKTRPSESKSYAYKAVSMYIIIVSAEWP
jgi:hypothetical protein